MIIALLCFLNFFFRAVSARLYNVESLAVSLCHGWCEQEYHMAENAATA